MNGELPPQEKVEMLEQEPITAEQLLSACLDLRLAIRAQVSKAGAMHRQKLQQWARRSTTTNLTAEEYIMKMAQKDRLPTAAELRGLLRNSHRVAAGTGFEDGHMIHHSYGVFEDEQYAKYGKKHPESRLVITHVTKKINRLEGIIQMSADAMRDSETEEPLYTVDIIGQSVTVNQGSRQLEAAELSQPYDIIQQARLLYV